MSSILTKDFTGGGASCLKGDVFMRPSVFRAVAKSWEVPLEFGILWEAG